MAHDLLIAATVLRPDYSGGYLQPFELLRGQENNLTVTVKNLSGDEFPGGTINDIVLRYGPPGDSRAEFVEVLKIGRLTPQEESALSPTIDIIPITDGETWLTLRAQATDGEPINCFQNEEGQRVGTSQWVGAFYTVNREHHEIIQLLTRLLDTQKG